MVEHPASDAKEDGESTNEVAASVIDPSTAKSDRVDDITKTTERVFESNNEKVSNSISETIPGESLPRLEKTLDVETSNSCRSSTGEPADPSNAKPRTFNAPTTKVEPNCSTAPLQQEPSPPKPDSLESKRNSSPKGNKRP